MQFVKLKCWTYVWTPASAPEIASSPEPPWRKSSSQPPKITSSLLFASNSGWSAPSEFGVRLNGVMSNANESTSLTLIVEVCTWPGV